MTFSYLYTVIFMCLLLAAGFGVQFSPSFTAMFLMAFLIAEAISALCGYWARKCGKRVLLLTEHLLSIIGVLFVFPSVIIYAAGDDWLGTCIQTTILGSLPLYFGDLPWRRVYNPRWEDIQVGDVLDYRNEYSGHAIVVIEKTAKYVKVTESGINNHALWGGQYPRWWLEQQPGYCLNTRYPQ